jgi:hypothetical protein
MSAQETLFFFFFLVVVLGIVIVVFFRILGLGGGGSGDKSKGNAKAFLVVLGIVVIIYLLLVIEARGPEIKSWLFSAWNSFLINIVQPIAAIVMSVALVVLLFWGIFLAIRSWHSRR